MRRLTLLFCVLCLGAFAYANGNSEDVYDESLEPEIDIDYDSLWDYDVSIRDIDRRSESIRVTFYYTTIQELRDFVNSGGEISATKARNVYAEEADGSDILDSAASSYSRSDLVDVHWKLPDALEESTGLSGLVLVKVSVRCQFSITVTLEDGTKMDAAQYGTTEKSLSYYLKRDL